MRRGYLAICLSVAFAMSFSACSMLENLAGTLGDESNSNSAQNAQKSQKERASLGSILGKNTPGNAVDSEVVVSNAYSDIPFDSMANRMGLKILEIRSFEMAFYDFAAVTQKGKNIEITLYKLGAVVGKIELGGKICFNSNCVGKWRAAKNFFGAVSYGDLFADIVLGRDIFNGLGKRIIDGGALVQYFTKSGEEFYYERRDGVILFENLSNGVKISIQNYQ